MAIFRPAHEIQEPPRKVALANAESAMATSESAMVAAETRVLKPAAAEDVLLESEAPTDE